MMGEVEEMAELLTEQASDLMFVVLALEKYCRMHDEVVARESIRKRQRW